MIINGAKQFRQAIQQYAFDLKLLLASGILRADKKCIAFAKSKYFCVKIEHIQSTDVQYKTRHFSKISRRWCHTTDLSVTCIFFNGFSGASGVEPPVRYESNSCWTQSQPKRIGATRIIAKQPTKLYK